MRSLDIIPPIAWVDNYPFDYKSMKSYYEDLFSYENLKNKRYQPTQTGDAITSYMSNDTKQPHKQEHNKDFNTWLNNQLLDIFLNVYGYQVDFTRLIVTNSWSNKNKRGGKTQPHHHKTADWVVNSYLNVPKNSGKLILHPPNIDNNFGYEPRRIDVQTNDVVVFPAWLIHETEKSESDEDRVTMSYNIKIDIASNDIMASYLV